MVNDIKDFLSGLNTTLTSVREVTQFYDSKIAFEFNLFNFLRPDENKYSEILAYFLNPNQKHGQGKVFLDIFLKHVELDALIDKPMQIAWEKGIDHLRRVDILLSFNGNEFGLAIENKIGAPDQENQLADYLKYLEKNYHQYQLFYLNPNGDSPSKNSIEKKELFNAKRDKKVQIISYQEDIVWCLEQWMQCCQADKVRLFLSEFEQYIKHNILGERFMKEQDIIANCILSSNMNVELAFSINESLQQVKRQMIAELKKIIEEIAESNNLKCDFNVNLKKNDGFAFVSNCWKYSKLSFMFDQKDLNYMYYGIWIDNSKNPPPELAKSIFNRIGGKPNQSWASCKDMEYPYKDWGYCAAPWIGIRNGELKNRIEGIVKDILLKLEGLPL